MHRILLPVLLALVSASPAAAAAPAFDVDKFVPADAVVYVTADGLDPVEGAAGAFLENVMPGAGQIVDGMLLARAPAIATVDRSRPIAMWMLASGATVIVLPIRDAATFEQLARQSVGTEDRVTTIGGYGIVTRGGAVDLAAIGAQGTAAAPAIGGQVRGFVELGRVMAARLGTARSELTPLLGRLEGLPRVDFAVAASHDRVELSATVPAAEGLLAQLAPPLPPVQNRFLDVLPADAALVFATSAPERMAAVSEALFGSLAARGPDGSKQHAMVRRMRRQAKVWTALSHGDSTTAVSIPRGPESTSLIQAFSCLRPRHARILMHKMTRHLSRGTTATPVDVKYVPGAEQIGDVAVDQLVIAALTAGSATPQPGAAVPSFMQEPIRYAFLRDTGVTTYGADGLERMRAALASVGSGVVAPEIRKAIPPGALMAVAVRPVRFATGGASGGEYATLAVVPRGTALDVRVVVPAGALPRGPGLLGAGFGRGSR